MHRRHAFTTALGAFAAMTLSLGCVVSAGARTWTVPLELPTIQAGLAAAASGDTVLVDCGTYLEHSLVLRGGVTLRSATGDPACVVVDAQQLGRVFDLAGETEPAVVEGLTITGGATPDGWFEAMGGGIRVQNSELHLLRCVFTGNTARIGAGVAAYRSVVEIDSCAFTQNDAAHAVWAAGGGIWSLESSGSITATSFTANTAFSSNVDDPGDGGAVLANLSELAVTDCEFVGNSTGGGGGAYYSLSLDRTALLRCLFEANSAAWGGAMYFEYDARTTVDLCEFRNNTAGAGGALLVDTGCYPIFWDCIFEGNTATVSGGGAAQCWVSGPYFSGCRFIANSTVTEGGALFLGGAGARIEDCSFVENSAATQGGAVHYRSNASTLLRCTLVGNSAPTGSSVSAVMGAQPNLRRSILAFAPQGSAVVADATSSYVASCTDIFGNVDGDWTAPIASLLGVGGNFSSDPLFVDASGGDLRVRCESPCAPAQSGSCGRIGAFAAYCPDEEPVAAPQARAGSLAATVAPNPFNAHTRIAFDLPESGPVRVAIYGMDGRRIRVLVRGALEAGAHEVVWDGRDDRGANVASGTYVCRVQTARESLALKLGLVK